LIEYQLAFSTRKEEKENEDENKDEKEKTQPSNDI